MCYDFWTQEKELENNCQKKVFCGDIRRCTLSLFIFLLQYFAFAFYESMNNIELIYVFWVKKQLMFTFLRWLSSHLNISSSKEFLCFHRSILVPLTIEVGRGYQRSCFWLFSVQLFHLSILKISGSGLFAEASMVKSY